MKKKTTTTTLMKTKHLIPKIKGYKENRCPSSSISLDF